MWALWIIMSVVCSSRIYNMLFADGLAPIWRRSLWASQWYVISHISESGERFKNALHTMTSSNGNIFRVTGPLCGEFTGPGEFPAQKPVTRSFDVFFDLRPNKRLSKQPWGWWFETTSRSLWRQCNECLKVSNRFEIWQAFRKHNRLPNPHLARLCEILR